MIQKRNNPEVIFEQNSARKFTLIKNSEIINLLIYKFSKFIKNY